MSAAKPLIGIVVIARNEGERLRRCLGSLAAHEGPVVYVDSGSTDGSLALARNWGAHVIELDPDLPFTMARARNAGANHLVHAREGVDFIQFIDGDCELAPLWLARALQALKNDARTAAVCGRRRERHPQASPYNRLCDMEWHRPPGLTKACGGDVLMRVHAFRQVNGFDARLIAGEEPELCLRLRRLGWRILRLPVDMTFHDAAMTHFQQWWRRNLRGGYAYAEGATMHRRGPERHNLRQLLSTLCWGLAVPVAALVGLFAGPLQPDLLLLLPLAVSACLLVLLRIYCSRRKLGDSPADARLYARFCLLGKVPQSLGALRYLFLRLQGRPSQIIEYKSAATSS